MLPQTHYRMHPLIAAAAVSVTVVSMMGMARLAGVFPGVSPPVVVTTAAAPAAMTVKGANVSDAVSILPASSVPAATSLDPGEAIVPVRVAASLGSANPATSDTLTTQSGVQARRRSAEVAADAKLEAVPARSATEHRIRHASLPRPRRSVVQQTDGGTLYGASATAGETVAGAAPMAADQAPRIVPVYRPMNRVEAQAAIVDATPASPAPPAPRIRDDAGEGTALGRSISFGIDHTVSAIADLLSGGNSTQAPLSERRSPIDSPAR
jgi:hypothetical protein